MGVISALVDSGACILLQVATLSAVLGDALLHHLINGVSFLVVGLASGFDLAREPLRALVLTLGLAIFPHILSIAAGRASITADRPLALFEAHQIVLIVAALTSGRVSIEQV